jgi:diketogulonate reductase-like aldo/keto reductase
MPSTSEITLNDSTSMPIVSERLQRIGIIKSREELFITTKISDDFFNVTKSIDVSLQKLGLSYVDLYDSTFPCSLFLGCYLCQT